MSSVTLASLRPRKLEKAPVAPDATRRDAAGATGATPGFIKTGISPVLSYSHGLLFKVLKFKSGAALPSAIDMRNIAGLPDPPARPSVRVRPPMNDAIKSQKSKAAAKKEIESPRFG